MTAMDTWQRTLGDGDAGQVGPPWVPCSRCGGYWGRGQLANDVCPACHGLDAARDPGYQASAWPPPPLPGLAAGLPPIEFSLCKTCGREFAPATPADDGCIVCVQWDVPDVLSRALKRKPKEKGAHAGLLALANAAQGGAR